MHKRRGWGELLVGVRRLRAQGWAKRDTYLLDAGVTGSSTNVVKTELTKIDLGQGLWRGNLTGLGWEDPVDLDRLSEVEMGREDADLLGLTLKGEREGGVGGSGDVGLVDMQHSSVERMVGNGVEDGKQSDGEGDEKKNGGNKETAVTEFSRKVLVLVRTAASTNETDGLTGLVEASARASALGSNRVDGLSRRASTKVLPGAVSVVHHVEGTQLPSTGWEVLRRWVGTVKASTEIGGG